MGVVLVFVIPYRHGIFESAINICGYIQSEKKCPFFAEEASVYQYY
jgi:hypothetical protein